MAVKAVWHGADSVEAISALHAVPDPFADDATPVRVTQVGIPIDVNADRPTLEHRLADLLDAESDLFNADVTCVIKDCVHTSCFACPLYEIAADRAPLCRLGREQERVLTLLSVLKSGERRQ